MKVTLPPRTVKQWRDVALLARGFRHDGRDDYAGALEEILSTKVHAGLARTYSRAAHHRVRVENALVHAMIKHMENGEPLPKGRLRTYKATAHVHADGNHFWVHPGAQVMVTQSHHNEMARAR